MRKAALLLAGVLVFAIGCQRGEEPTPVSEYVLYFLDGGGEQGLGIGHGPALRTQPWEGEDPEPEELVQALLDGPTAEGLRSPFPRGVTLQSWEWDEERPGNLRLRLSEQYSGLTDISLTLADYAIVLTLTQLEGVESVEILTSNYSSHYRSHQILTPEEAVLSDPLVGEPDLS